jgi:hypothetical protein
MDDWQSSKISLRLHVQEDLVKVLLKIEPVTASTSQSQYTKLFIVFLISPPPPPTFLPPHSLTLSLSLSLSLSLFHRVAKELRCFRTRVCTGVSCSAYNRGKRRGRKGYVRKGPVQSIVLRAYNRCHGAQFFLLFFFFFLLFPA